jgi:hypothetical protein
MLERGGVIEPFLRAGVRIRHIQLLEHFHACWNRRDFRNGVDM